MEDRIGSAVRALGWQLGAVYEPLSGSMSGAGVVRARSVSGDEVVVKVSLDDAIRTMARRELAFYRTLATHLPIRTPTLLRWVDTDDVTALMFPAYDPAPPARQWDGAAWSAMARQLAALHTTTVDDPRAWAHPSWLLDALAPPKIDWARDYWLSRIASDDVAYLDTQTRCLHDAIVASPPCLTHGDCHVGNMLLDGGTLVWADWQAVAIGNPAVELAFLWMRANSDSADVPYEQMIDLYLAESGADRETGDRFQRSVIAGEIGILMIAWPMFAAMHPQDEQERVARRLADLVRQWRGERGARTT